MNAEQRLDAWVSTPIINIIQVSPDFCGEVQRDRARVYSRCRISEARCVQWLKTRLGAQDYCWIGEYRFWVWECSLPGVCRQSARIFASNIQGWSFEVNAKLSPEDSMKVWRDFICQVEDA